MSPRVSPLDNETCRQCTSFADYVKKTRKQLNSENTDELCPAEEVPMKPQRPDCPLDKDELGNKSWGLLHTIAASYPDKPTCEQKKNVVHFFQAFSKVYPCEHCAADLRDELQENPPKVESQKALSRWLCEVHNRVNAKLDKPLFDCSLVNQRWKDGWLDGSCD